MPELCERMGELVEHSLSPYEILPPRYALGCSLGAVLRGQPEIFGQLIAQIRRGMWVSSELARRRRLLAAERAS